MKKKLVSLALAGVLALGGVEASVGSFNSNTTIVQAKSKKCEHKLKVKSITLGLGETISLSDICEADSNTTCKEAPSMRSPFDSNNPYKLYIEGDTIKATDLGTTYVELKDGDNYFGNYVTGKAVKRIKVLVKKEPKSVKFSKKTKTIELGEIYKMPSLKISKGAYSFKKEYSYDTDALSIVDNRKLLIGNKVGTYTITVTAFNGLKATLKVKVIKK